MDNEGNIWIGTEQGLAKWNRQTNQVNAISFFKDKIIKYIYKDKEGNLWISCINFFTKIDAKGKITEFSFPFLKNNNNFISYLEEVKNYQGGKLIMVGIEHTPITIYKNIYFFDEKRQVWDLVIKTFGDIQSISSKGEVLIAYEQIHSLQREELLSENFKTKELSIKSIFFPDRLPLVKAKLKNVKYKNDIWFLGAETMFQVDKKTGEFTKFLGKSYFVEDDELYILQGLFKDNQENFWLYTQGTGFFVFPKYSIDNFKSYQVKGDNQEGISGNSVRGVYQDTEDNIWVSSYNDKGYVDIFSKNGKYYQVDLESVIYKIIPDADQKSLWVGTKGHLYKISKENKKILKAYKIPYHIFDILQVSYSKIYIASPTFLLVFNSETEEFKSYNHIQQTTCLFMDSQDKFWIGSSDKGLGLLDLEIMQVQYFSNQKNNLKSISSNHVKSIYEDTKGQLWIATTLGLNLFDRKTQEFTRFTEKDGLPNNMVYAILEDEEGNLWLSTNKGISQFNPKTKKFTNYDASYGLQDNEFNTNAFFKNEKTGEMFFGGIRGLNSFYPEKMKRNEFIPPMVLTSFKRKGKVIDLGKAWSQIKEIRMEYDQAQSLTFEFVALSFFQSYKNQYAYKIEEIHRDWISLGTQKELTLTNLNAGTYTLRIKGSNNHGLWNEKGLTIKLIVSPPFWQTWWFIGIILLLALLAFYGIYRWRVYQLKHREKFLESEVNNRTEEIKAQAEVLEKQAQELSEANRTKDQLLAIIAHDLRGPMVAFESVVQQLDFYIAHNEIERVKDLSQYIKNSSNNLNDLLNNLLSWALLQKDFLIYQPQNLRLRQIVEEVNKNYEILIQNYQIETKLSIAENLEIYADENALSTILRNLVSNAIKFTPKKGWIEVKAYPEKNACIIEIIDTGKGIPQEKIADLFKSTNIKNSKGLRGEKGTGLGLVLVGELMEKHQGTIQVLSQEKKGTTMQLKFPNSKPYPNSAHS